VIALEADPDLPGCRTRYAQVHYVSDINGYGLITALQSLRQNMPSNPVLILTNDNMVRTVGQNWEQLEGLYHLSWAECRERLLPLLDKSALEAHCLAQQLLYPHSQLLNHGEQVDTLLTTGQLTFPLIVKPTRPLSGFKVRLIHDRNGLDTLIYHYAHALPFLLQQWIPGDDRRILFVAFYLDQGRILAKFCGRKLLADPPSLGQAIIVESYASKMATKIAQQFFLPLKLSGPVALEIKFDPENKPWVIEPNLGRTEYCLDCCVANGVNLPLVEYQHQSGLPIHTPQQTSGVIWFDTERRPLSYLGLRLRGGETATHPWKARFAYWDNTDTAPFRHGLVRLAKKTVSRVFNRLRKMV